MRCSQFMLDGLLKVTELICQPMAPDPTTLENARSPNRPKNPLAFSADRAMIFIILYYLGVKMKLSGIKKIMS